MLKTAFAGGVAAARAAGWRAYAIALLGYAFPVAADASRLAPLTALAIGLQTIATLALVRVLGAWRPEPVPAPPQVDDEGRRVLPARNPGPPVTPEDRRPVTALRNAFRLWAPAVRFSMIALLAVVGALFTAFAVTGGRLAEAGPTAVRATALPISTLFLAFLAVAPQRIALEGEPRVLVAVAHSVRVARTNYGLLLFLTVAEAAAMFGASLLVPDKDPALGQALAVLGGAAVVAAAVQVLTTAVATEVYLRSPRLELPVDPRTG